MQVHLHTVAPEDQNSHSEIMSTIRKMMTQLLLWPLLTQCILAANDDCHWVRVIYGKMGGDVSDILEDCCRMKRVICEQGRVTVLSWGNKGLKGYIPPEIGNLVNLQNL